MAAPAGSQIVGTAGTLNVGSTNLIPQVATELISYDDRSRPIFSVMAKMGMIEDAHNPTYQWQEIQFDEPSVNCETGIIAAAAGATFSAVIDTLNAVPGDQFEEASTNQLFEIQTVSSQNVGAVTSTCVFIKRPSTVAITIVGVNSAFLRMGNTMLEGGLFSDTTIKTPLRLTNTITQINTQVAITKLMEQMWTYYGKSQFELDLENKQKQLNHDIERRVIFGKQYEEAGAITRSGGADTGTARGSRGVWDSIQTKRIQYSGAMTETGLDAYLSNYLFGDVYGGGDMKFAFSGNSVYNDIAGFVKNKFRKLDSIGTYGLQINEYVSPVGNGSLYFVEERQFFSQASYQNTILALDPAYFRLMKVGPALMSVQDTSPKNKSIKSLAIEVWLGVKLMTERFHGIYSHTI